MEVEEASGKEYVGDGELVARHRFLESNWLLSEES